MFVKEIIKNTNLFEYNRAPDSKEDDAFDLNPKLSKEQATLVRAIHTSDAFSVRNSLNGLKSMLK